MKKFLAILLAALMIFGVTACSSSQEPAAEPDVAEGTETEAEGTEGVGSLFGQPEGGCNLSVYTGFAQ